MFAVESYFDDRGSMSLLFETDRLDGVSCDIIKISQGKKGVLRGFHMQNIPSEQSKWVFVLEGTIQDVCLEIGVDGRPTGRTKNYKLRWQRSGKDKALYVPSNWAHGYLVLSDFARVLYVCDGKYGNEVSYNPLKWYQGWEMDSATLIMSQKDRDGL